MPHNVQKLIYNFLYLQTGWSISVELVIGPDDGISCLTDKASTVSFNLFQTVSDRKKVVLHFAVDNV